MVKQELTECRNIVLVDHTSMLSDGNPILSLFQDDKYHLNERGVSILANNLKRAIHQALDVPLPVPLRHSRRQSRRRTNQQQTGGGRGRGLINFRK